MSEKYISVETAVALAMQYCPDDDGACSKAGHDLRELLDDLENTAPADVRPVVFCRDCRFWGGRNGKNECSLITSLADPRIWLKTQPDDFCSSGERREGGTDRCC